MRKIILLLIVALSVASCVKEDFFGLSDAADVLKIQVANQVGNAVVDKEKRSIQLSMTAGLSISAIAIEQLELSSFASADKKVGDVLNLNQANTLNITAEDGSVLKWNITASYASAEQQLENTDFNAWYEVQGVTNKYKEPGAAADNTIWCTGNKGSSILDIYATKPLLQGEEDYVVEMTTCSNGASGTIMKTPISAGSIVTGVFGDKVVPSNPRAAIDFGTLFTGRPKSFSINYSYLPGAVNKNKEGKKLDYGDQCDIYAILEVRKEIDGVEKIQRLATAWFRSGDGQEEEKAIAVEFTYGALGSDVPNYMKPADGAYVSAEEEEYILPTHLIFVATSSCEGDQFSGAVGSKLCVDDLRMNY